MSEIWEERRPSRVRVVRTYAKRVARWRKNSSPYLSGDLFADNSDISVFPPHFRGKMPTVPEIRSARVIFCPSEKLEEFFQEYRKDIYAKVIICGNSDFEFLKLPSNIPPTVKQLFLQNSFVSDRRLVTTLPIGVENFRWGVNGHPNDLRLGGAWIERRNEVVIGPFGLTHPIRNEVRRNFLPPAEGINFIANRMEPVDYAKLAQETRYVAAVRGNGVDTHRHWETMYRGGIPLILKDAWSAGIADLNLPFLEVRAWNPGELQNILLNVEDLGFSPENVQALWWPFWKKLITSYL
jgi:hypothetical protein